MMLNTAHGNWIIVPLECLNTSSLTLWHPSPTKSITASLLPADTKESVTPFPRFCCQSCPNPSMAQEQSMPREDSLDALFYVYFWALGNINFLRQGWIR